MRCWTHPDGFHGGWSLGPCRNFLAATSRTFLGISRRIFPSLGAIPATLGQCAITANQCHRTRDLSILGRNEAHEKSWKYIAMRWFDVSVEANGKSLLLHDRTPGNWLFFRGWRVSMVPYCAVVEFFCYVIRGSEMIWDDLYWASKRRFIQLKMVIRMPCLSSASKPQEISFWVHTM